MPDKSYKVNNEVFDIPEGKIQGFLIDFPGAIEIETFTVEQDTFDIPTTKVEGFLAEVPNAIPLKKKDIPGTTTTTVSEVSGSETLSTSQEVFDTFFKVAPSKVEETTIEETKEEVTPEPEEQQVTVDTQGEMSFRMPTPEEEKGLVKKVPGEDKYEKQVLAEAPTMYSYGENELYNQEQIGEMKKISQQAIDEILPTEAPKDKDYTATFEQLREKLTEHHPDNPAYIDSEIGMVQSNILTTDVIESFSKLHPQYQEEFITMGGMDMENFKRGYRNLGFDDDVIDRVVSSVVEGQRDDMLIKKQIDVFKEDHPEFDDNKINKFIYKNAVSDAYSMMNEDEIKTSKLNAELQLLLEEDEPDYDRIMDLRNQLDKSREGQFYDSFTGLRINTEELAEDKEYEEQVIAVAREIKKQPNLMEKLEEGMSESYLVHKRLHDLYLREATRLREGYDPGAVGQRRQYGDTEYDKQKDKVDNLYRLQNQARIEQDAWARMFLLNEDPGEAEKGLKHYGEMIGKSFIGSLFGEQAGSNAFSVTQRERLDVMEQVLSGKDIELTQKQKENLKRDFSEDALEMGGGLGGVVIKFWLLNKAGAGLKIPQMVKFLRGGGKLSNTVATIMEASIEGVKFQMIGGAPGAGEAFYATQRLLPDIKVGGKWKHILTPIVNVLYKADIGMTTASNVSATIEAGIKALEQDRDFKNVMKEQFGDLSNFQHHVLTELSVNWMFGLAHLKNPTSVIKRANELSDRVGKVIEEFKADPRRTKAEIGEIEKLKNRLDLETGILEKGEAIDLRDPKSEYTISGEGFKAEGEQVTEQKLMQNLRKPEFVEKVKAGTINLELRNVTPKLKDKVERILGETEAVVIKEAKVAEKAPETEVETLEEKIEIAKVELNKLKSTEKKTTEEISTDAIKAEELESKIFKEEKELRGLVEVEEDAKRITSLEAKAPKDLIGEQADYGGIKGKIAKDSEGNMVIETVEGEQHIIEGGRSGKTAKELGIEITEARRLPIEEINEIVESIPDTEIQVKVSFDGKANTVRLYGNEYTYEKLNLDENGNPVSLQVTDAKGNSKTIKNQDALIEIEIQKEAWDLKQTGEISVKEITTEAEKQNLKEDESKIKDEQRRKRDTEQVLPERPTEDTKRVEPEKKPREEPTEVEETTAKSTQKDLEKVDNDAMDSIIGDDVLYHGTSAEVTKDFLDIQFEKQFAEGSTSFSAGVQGLGKMYSRSKDNASSFIDFSKKDIGKVIFAQYTPENPINLLNLQKVFKQVEKHWRSIGGKKGASRSEMNKAYKEKLIQDGYDAIIFKEGPISSPSSRKWASEVIVPLKKTPIMVATQEYGTRGQGSISEIKYNIEGISKAYHAAKKDGTNPELVKAVEKALGKEAKIKPPEAEKPVEAKEEVEVTKPLKNVESTEKAIRSMPKKDIPKISDTPLTRDQFNKKYIAQHKDIRGRKENKWEENKKKILKDGLNEGVNVNALPIYTGIERTVIDKAYGNKKGDIIYILTKQGVTEGVNGYRTKKGYKPKLSDVVIIEYNKQSTYEAYKNQFENPKYISEAYHAAKKDGTNPELVKAVEKALGKEAKVKLKAEKPVEAKEEVAEKPVEEAKIEFKEHITTGTKEQAGKYEVRKEGEEIKIFNADSGKEVKLTKQNKWAVDQYVEANLKALRSGEKAKLPEGVVEGDINRLIAEESSNPEEIASAWIFSKELKDPSEMTFEEAVYESAWNIDPETFRKTVGYGTKDVPHLLNRFKKGGEGFDSIAERVEETMNMAEGQTGAIVEGQKTKEGETVQRIINVLTSKDFKNYKPSRETQDQIDLSTKFKELTGLRLTKAIAKKVTDHRSKMEKFADALDKKADEFDFPGVPFFLAPRLVKIALKSIAAAIRKGIEIGRAISLALNKVKREKEKEEKWDEKEFRQFFKEQVSEPFAKVKIPKGTQVKTAIEKEVGIKKEKVVETLTTKQYYKFIEKIGKQYAKFAEKETRVEIKENKKAMSLMQEEVVSFVKANIEDLKRVSGRSVPALMKKIANIQPGRPKALKDVIDYIEKIASGQAEKDRLAAIEGVRNTVETAISKADRKASSGGLTARAFTGEGKKSIETLKKSFDMTEQEASDRGTHIEAKINSLEGQRIEDITDAKRNEIDDKIFELQKEAEYIELYSDLNNKSKEEVDGISELLKGEIASLKEDLKGKRKERSEKFKNKKEDIVKGIGEAMWEKEPEKPGVGASYLAKQLNPKNLLTQLAGKAGEPLGKSFDVGQEKAVSTELKMKKSVKKSVNEFFGSESDMRKVLNKEVKINLVKETKDAEGNVIEVSSEPRKVKVSNLAHLWASYKSESNHIYTQRIASGKERLKLSPEEWLRIDALLPNSVKNFTDWIVKDFLPEHYEQANKVYYERNFINLTKLPDYLFVNAERVRDATAALTDINRVSTYKPFTTQRVYGEYNLWGNDIYSGLMKHIDQHSKFVGLSKPISEVNALLNSKDVSRLIKQKGLQPYKSSLEHMMTVGMAGDKRYFLPDLLFGNFVGSKVLMNLSLFPKQMTSFITVLDPQYTSTGELMRSIGRISTNKQARKRAINILEGSGLFSTRNIKEIETHIKKGNPFWAERVIDRIADKMEDKRLTKAIKTVGEFIWNPTQKGDRFTIRLGGIPLIDAVYRTKLNRLIKDGVGKEEAKIMATNEALYKFNEWMSDTQQSMQWTGKSEFQTGKLRYLAPFMNAPMSYSRKVITSYRDVYRGMKAERKKLLKENPTMNPHVATIKSLKGVKGADLQRIALYQMALPVLWSAVTTAGRSVVNLWSDDEKKRKQAWMDLGYDTTLGWAKGLYAIGFVMDYLYGSATGRKYGRQADNIFRLFDDGMNLLTSLMDTYKESVELSEDLTDEEYKKQKKKVVKAYTKAGVNLTAVLGLPQMAAKRTVDVVTDDLYNTSFKKLARLYGMRRESIEEWFEFEIEPEKFEAKEQYLNRMQKQKGKEFTQDEINKAKRTYNVYKTNNEQIIYFYKHLYTKNDNTEKANYLMDVYDNTKNDKLFYELDELGLISDNLYHLYRERKKVKKKK